MAILIEDIQDKESLEAWLEALPGTDQEKHQAAAFISARAAARVLPRAWVYKKFIPRNLIVI